MQALPIGVYIHAAPAAYAEEGCTEALAAPTKCNPFTEATRPLGMKLHFSSTGSEAKAFFNRGVVAFNRTQSFTATDD
jgi:hypothetical protein